MAYTLSNEIKHYLTMNISLIDACDFENLYEESEAHSIPHRDISDALLQAGINPLEYMDFIPYGFLRHSKRSNKDFIIPDTIKSIEGYAFTGTDIEVIKIPEGVEEILQGAFSNCPDLHKVYFPNSLKKLGQKLFTGSNTKDNNGILHIIYNGTRQEWSKIEKGVHWPSLNPQFDVIIECANDIFSYSDATGEIDLI
jgi:hypothetical protein